MVLADVGNLAETVEQPERLQDRGVNADANARVAFFNALQGSSRGKRALGDNAHWQAPPTARVMNVGAELAKRTTHSSRGMVGGWHIVIFMLL
jgi:hypothetical protein